MQTNDLTEEVLDEVHIRHSITTTLSYARTQLRVGTARRGHYDSELPPADLRSPQAGHAEDHQAENHPTVRNAHDRT